MQQVLTKHNIYNCLITFVQVTATHRRRATIVSTVTVSRWTRGVEQVGTGSWPTRSNTSHCQISCQTLLWQVVTCTLLAILTIVCTICVLQELQLPSQVFLCPAVCPPRPHPATSTPPCPPTWWRWRSLAELWRALSAGLRDPAVSGACLIATGTGPVTCFCDRHVPALTRDQTLQL